MKQRNVSVKAGGAAKRQAKPLQRPSGATKTRRAKARAKPLQRVAKDADVQRGRQVIRHLRIATALSAAPGGLTAKELKEVVGHDCDLRTIYRDLEDLEEAGFGIHSERHRYCLGPSAARWRLPVETAELLALLLAQQVLKPVLGSDVAQPLVTLSNKLLAALSPTQRAYCADISRLGAATHIAPADLTGRHEVVATVREALVKEQVTRITYEEPNEPPEVRDVEPYATWYIGGRLYLIARCRQAQDMRTFGLPRIKSAQILDDTFDVDPGFNLEEFVTRGFGVYHGAVHRVSIELGPEVAHLAKERIYHHSQQVEELQRGVARLTFEAAGLPEIATWVAGFGGKARVVEPAELVERVQAIHCNGLAAYERPEGKSAGNAEPSGALSSDVNAVE